VYQDEAQHLQGESFQDAEVMFGLKMMLVIVQRASAREVVVIQREVSHVRAAVGEIWAQS
jgi:hypothetical protein